MKRFDHKLKQPQKSTLALKYLVVVMASIMVAPAAQADSTGKKIGDLEIYKAAEGGKVTIAMMLDTSGSMDATVTTDACDLPKNMSSSSVSTQSSSTSPSYTKKYCTSGKTYFYSKDRNSKWYRCGGEDGLGNTDRSKCTTELDTAPSVVGYNNETSSRTTYYYNDKYYDRLTRLKDALFTLMDSTALDSNKVAIGIGQFSSQSNNQNTFNNADGTTGKMIVPAAIMSMSQRAAIKTAVANLTGYNGTPTANAYAEVGAYMLGTTTKTFIKVKKEFYIKNGNSYLECTSWNNTGTVCRGYREKDLSINTSGYTSAKCGYYTSNNCLSKEVDVEAEGSGFDKSIQASKLGDKYASPLLSNVSTTSASTCDGRGIYFLTDGEPNSSYYPLDLMKAALGTKGSLFNLPSSGNLPSGTQNGHGMPEVGAFARALRSPTLNPLGKDQDILTAVVGFGKVFEVDIEDDAAKAETDRIIRRITYVDSKGSRKTSDFYNCTKISGTDAKNACNWGAKSHSSLPGVGGFGEGGFYSAQSTEDIVNSITSFVSDLDQTLPSIPSGTIIIPDDPYRADSQLAVAYYPTLQPKVSEKAVIWEGNMKKYGLMEGTLYGKNNKKLFENVAGELNKDAPDLWSDDDYLNANDKVESGGFYANLNTPNTGVASVRSLYVEDWDAVNNKPVLKKFGVNSAGKVTVDDAALSATSFQDTGTYNEPTLRKLLNYLGFDRLPATTVLVKNMTLSTTNTSAAIKVVGATIHSTPASVSYSADLDDNGKVTDKRDDYVLFGSSEGGIHLVDANDYSVAGDGGKEKLVIIPRQMLIDPLKSDALIKGAIKSNTGSPNFGVDAPWLVTADYKYDFANKKVTVDTANNKGIFAFGGLRMGGEAFYGINLNNKNNPEMMFSINSDTTGFSRMGQIWSKPTKAKIKTSASDSGTDVLVFGGGYDMCYENDGFQVGITNTALGVCSGQSSAKGNAVYIVNAKSGALIWSASSDSSANAVVSGMTNSVVAGVTVLDRDNDGFMDHIYFADLGGQLFRADFTNAGFVKPATSGTAARAEGAFSNTRVTRLLNNSYTATDTKKYAYRFYERPVVSFYRGASNQLFALINIISGDRSSPLSVMRDSDSVADRLYGIIDSDVTKSDTSFYASDFTSASNINGQIITNLTDSDLAQLPLSMGGANAIAHLEFYSVSQKNAVINTLKSGGKKGWYYPLTRFDGYNNVRYSKGVGKSEVIDSFLYTTVYNPDMSYGTTNSCSAKIVGGSERQLYCLPYGICLDNDSKNGTAGYARAGQGIQELTLGPRSSTLSNQRLLIGTQTLTERAKKENRVDFGYDVLKGTDSPIDRIQNLTQDNQKKGGSGTAPEMIFHERFTLQPKIWYEVE